MAHLKRKKLFVDCEVQRLLVVRIIVYWLACMATLELLLLTWSIASGPEQPTFWAYFINYDWPAVGLRMLVALVVLVPIVWDALIFSNRFAGPIFRMGRVLREVAKSGTIEHVRLRRGDYWHGFADDLNAALARLAPLRCGPGLSAAQIEQTTGGPPADEADAERPADNLSPAR